MTSFITYTQALSYVAFGDYGQLEQHLVDEKAAAKAWGKFTNKTCLLKALRLLQEKPEFYGKTSLSEEEMDVWHAHTHITRGNSTYGANPAMVHFFIEESGKSIDTLYGSLLIRMA